MSPFFPGLPFSQILYFLSTSGKLIHSVFKTGVQLHYICISLGMRSLEQMQ